MTILNGCRLETVEPESKTLLIHGYRYNGTIKRTDTIFLNKKVNYDTLYFIYKNEMDTLGFSLWLNANSDTIMNIYGLNCPLVSTKVIQIDSINYKLCKYYYDIENSNDEETSFFYNENYGLLVGFNNGWGILSYTFEYDKISKILVDSILNDRSGFFQRYCPPPPPRSVELDSLLSEI